MKKRKRLTEKEKTMLAVSKLAIVSGWEGLTVEEYIYSTPEEVEEKKKRLIEVIEKGLEGLD